MQNTQLSSHSAFPVLHSPQQQRRTEAMSKYLISSTAWTWAASLSRPLRRHPGHSRTNSHLNIFAWAAPPSPLAFDRLGRTTGKGWSSVEGWKKNLRGVPDGNCTMQNNVQQELYYKVSILNACFSKRCLVRFEVAQSMPIQLLLSSLWFILRRCQ
jgi:hypothetical protein